MWWYGCSGGKRWPWSFSCHEPYGRLSYDQRFSFLTTSRWLSRFSWLSASRSVAIRSASSHRASSSWCDGHRLEVVRPVEPGRAVHRPAGGLDERDVLGLGDVPRALEHHVLEEVGEAGLARLTSCLEPTSYQRLTATTGARWSSATMSAQAVREALVGERDGRDVGRHAGTPGVRTPGGEGRRTRSSGDDRSAFGPGPRTAPPRPLDIGHASMLDII